VNPRSDPARSPGLTLVEVVVLVVICGVLLLLLIPWLLRQREGPRAARCTNNQFDLAKGLLQYESLQQHFPGYCNRVAKQPDGRWLAASWVVPILPYLERDDLYQEWVQGEATAAVLPGLICPDDPKAAPQPGTAPLSYVVNCGLPGDADTAAEGVFHNHNADLKPVYVSKDYVESHDGAAYTLLTSENLQAGYWSDVEEANVGMVWFREPGPTSNVNQGRDVGPRPQDVQYARPSSYHPGVAIVSYCDGHAATLSQWIDYGIYQRLMTPDDKAAGLRGDVDATRLKK